ncbi:MAG: iron ABC transporter permease [Fibrobacterota bacterium]
MKKVFPILAVLLFAAMFLSLLAGSSSLTATAALKSLLEGPYGASTDSGIVWFVRVPRVVVVAFVGAALAASGTAFQSLFRNPMADPSLLGIASGGALAAVQVLFHFPMAPIWVLPLVAFAGCFLAAAILVALTHFGGRPTMTTTLLTGVVLSSLFTSGTSLSLLLSDEYQLRQLVFWLSGGAEARSWLHVAIAIPPVLTGFAVLYSVSRWLDALALGEDHAESVGVPVERARLVVLVGAALSVGAAVSVCGPVGFVGLLVPHLLRPWVGAASRHLLPAAALGGALLLVVADFVARVWLPAGLQLGILTSLLGVPFFLWLLVRERQSVFR